MEYVCSRNGLVSRRPPRWFSLHGSLGVLNCGALNRGAWQVSEDEFKQRIKEMAVTMFEKDNNFDMAHAYEKLKVTMEKKLEAFLPPVTTVTAAAPGAKTSIPPKRGCDCTIS